MKSIIYKNPVIAAILLNLFTMFLSIYAIKYRITHLSIMLVSVSFLNRKILDNGTNMDYKKKIIISVSFVVMLGVFFFYSQYFYNIEK